MKQLNSVLSSRFHDICEDIKKSNSEDLDFYFGLACGFVSGLFLTDTIDYDGYMEMREYINTVSDKRILGGDC